MRWCYDARRLFVFSARVSARSASCHIHPTIILIPILSRVLLHPSHNSSEKIRKHGKSLTLISMDPSSMCFDVVMFTCYIALPTVR